MLASTSCAARLPLEELADLTERARAGDVTTQLELGDRYSQGRGVDADFLEAKRWYRAAADNGVPPPRRWLVCRGDGWVQSFDLLGEDGVFPTAVPRADADDIAPPVLVRKVDPKYTGAALQSNVEGQVWVDAVLMPEGVVGEARIIRSLDTTHGLDDEALCAAVQWQFSPATRDGQPIATLVTIVLEFKLK